MHQSADNELFNEENVNAGTSRDHPTPQLPVVRPDFAPSERNPSTSSSFPVHQYQLYFGDSDDVEEDIELPRSASNESEDVPVQEDVRLEERHLQNAPGPSKVVEEPCTSDPTPSQRLLPRESVEGSESSGNTEEMEVEEDADVTITQDNASQVTAQNLEREQRELLEKSETKPSFIEILKVRDINERHELLRKHYPRYLRSPVGQGAMNREDVARPLQVEDAIELRVQEQDSENVPSLEDVFQNLDETEKRKQLAKISSSIFDSYLKIKTTETLLEQLRFSANLYEIQKKQRDLYAFQQSFKQKVSWELQRAKPKRRFFWEKDDKAPTNQETRNAETELHQLEWIFQQPEQKKLVVLRDLFPAIYTPYKRMKKLESQVAELEQSGQDSEKIKEELEGVREKFEEARSNEMKEKVAGNESGRRGSRRMSLEKNVATTSRRRRGVVEESVEKDGAVAPDAPGASDALEAPEDVDGEATKSEEVRNSEDVASDDVNLQSSTNTASEDVAPEAALQNQVTLSEDVQSSDVGEEDNLLNSEDVQNTTGSEGVAPEDVQTSGIPMEDVEDSIQPEDVNMEDVDLQNPMDDVMAPEDVAPKDVTRDSEDVLNLPGTSNSSNVTSSEVVSRKRAQEDSEDVKKKKKKRRTEKVKRLFVLCKSSQRMNMNKSQNDSDSDSDDVPDRPYHSESGWFNRLHYSE